MSQRKARLEEEKAWREKVRVKPRVLLNFTRNLGLMLKSGLTVVDSLDTLSHQPEDPRFGQVVVELSLLTCQGYTLSKAMSLFPKVFSVLYYRMVEIGEQTGALEDSLFSLAQWSEKQHKIKSQMLSALSYPVLVLSVTFILTVALLTIFVPQVLEGFGAKEADLPAISQWLLSLSRLCQNPGFWFLVVAALGLLAPLAWRYFKTPEGALWALQIPMVGRLLLLGSSSRYALTLSTLLGNGVGLRRALSLCAEACGSPAIRLDRQRMLAGIDEGGTIAEMLSHRPQIYANLLIQMMKVGEESSKITEMLSRSADILAQDTEYLLDSLIAALEPLVMALVAMIVGTILIGVFASIYSQLGNL